MTDDILLLNVFDPDQVGSRIVDDTDAVQRLNSISTPADSPGPLQIQMPGNTIDASDRSVISQVLNQVTNNNAAAAPAGGLGIPKRFSNKRYRVFKLDLTTAQVNFPLQVPGTFFHAHWAATWTGTGIGVAGTTLLEGPAYDTGNGTNTRGAGDATVQATVRFDVANAEEIAFGPGYQRSGSSFERLFLSWGAQPAKVLEITIATDEPIDRIDAAN